MTKVKIFAITILVLSASAFGWIRVTKVDTDERQSSVAWLNNQYLICWSDGRDWAVDSAATIHAARISANGTLIDTNSFLVDGGYPDRLLPVVCAGSSDWIVAFQVGC
jgi:hypothetical protein